MKKLYISLLCCMALFCSSKLFAQGLVSVNNFTGTANVTIPLFNVTSGSLNAPVSVSYNGGGLKVKDVEGNAGMSWNLNAGGGIYRTVRGLPDDVKRDSAGNYRLGWLYNTDSAKIADFSIANTGFPNCTNEAADVSYINSNFNDLYDTEPDVYSVSAPGLSCQLYFAGPNQIRVMPYRDYKVSYVADGTTGLITSFTITNDQGVTYVFADLETEKRKLYTASTSTVTFYKRDYDLYKGAVNFSSAWRLTSMMDINGNALSFVYYPVDTYRTIPLNLAAGGSTTSSKLFTVVENMTSQVLDYIATSTNGSTPTAMVGFTYNGYARTGTVIASISGYGQTKTFTYVDANKRGSGVYGREFLHQLDLGDEQLTFTYKGLSTSVANPRISLPDSLSNKIDLWGYYNGSTATSLLPTVYVNPANTTLERYRNIDPGASSSYYSVTISGANRNAVPDSAKIGSLDSVKYSRGGYTTISYESNDYYDPTAAAVIQGGGIRVHEIKDFDGINTSSVHSRTYSYTDPLTSVSSGKPIWMPTYEFTTINPPFTSDWDDATVRSEDDLSPNDKTIIYGKVSETMPETGNTLYEYTTPATFWNASLPADWAPTTTLVARPACTILTYATSDINTYPFPNNTNYDFERGLITKVTNYNGSSAKVSESTYTYTRSATPTAITAFKWDNNAYLYAYAKYTIYVNTEELSSQVTTKTYDLGSTTAYKQSTIDYTYGSTYHKLARQQTTNSDGTINIANYKYVKDYVPTGTLDSAANAIYQLQLKNCNFPVETWQQVDKGGSDLTVGASLVKFKEFDFTSPTVVDYLPSQKLKFISGMGTSGFTPSSISSGAFTYDSGYIVTENDRQYNQYGYLQTADDNNKNMGTALTDPFNNETVASFANTAVNDIGYSNYDNSLPGAGFTGTFNYTVDGRTGFGIDFGTAYTQYKTVTKDPKAQNYIFSAWIKAASSGHVTLTLTDGSTSHAYTLNYASGSQYAYYQVALPLTGMGTSFTVAVNVSTDVLADDLLLYPDNAQVSTSAYNRITRQLEAQTNTNGKAAYYDYDQFNRPLTVYDNDRNILQRQSYVKRNGTDPADMGTGTLAVNTVGYVANFTATVPAVTNAYGLIFTWDFGDGTTATGPAGSVTHTYTSDAIFPASVTVSSPYYPSKILTASVVMPGPVPTHYISVYSVAPDDGTADIIFVKFYQGGVLKYTFNQSDLHYGTTVPAGSYDVQVLVQGQPYNPGIGTGYGSVHTLSDTDESCQDMVVSKGTVTYNFTADLTGSTLTYYHLILDTVPCP